MCSLKRFFFFLSLADSCMFTRRVLADTGIYLENQVEE